MDLFNLTMDPTLQNEIKQFESMLKNLNLSVSDFSVLPHISQQEKIIKVTFYVAAMLLAVFGNLFVITIILSKKHLRTKFNMYVINLAVADLLIPVICMWMHLVTNFSPKQWYLGAFLCRIHIFMQVFVVSVSILTLTVTVVDRFAAALSPRILRCTQGHPVVILIVIWISAALLSLPWLLYTKLTTLEWFGEEDNLCRPHFPSPASRKAYSLVFAVSVFLIPVLTMFALIGYTYYNLPRTSTTTMEGKSSNQETKRKTLRMLFTVVVVFFLCWSPLQSIRLWDVFRTKDAHTTLPEGIHTLMYACYYVAYLSSCTNPVLIFTFNKSFREAAQHCFKRKTQRPLEAI